MATIIRPDGIEEVKLPGEECLIAGTFTKAIGFSKAEVIRECDRLLKEPNTHENLALLEKWVYATYQILSMDEYSFVMQKIEEKRRLLNENKTDTPA